MIIDIKKDVTRYLSFEAKDYQENVPSTLHKEV